MRRSKTDGGSETIYKITKNEEKDSSKETSVEKISL